MCELGWKIRGAEELEAELLNGDRGHERNTQEQHAGRSRIKTSKSLSDNLLVR